MRVILAVTVANLDAASRLRPALGWGHPSLTYMIRMRCHGCRWASMPIPLRVGTTIRRGTRHFNIITSCERCGNIGTVKILRTMGSPIVRTNVPMPVMLLEVMGLALDYSFVEFEFSWTLVSGYNGRWVPPFILINGSRSLPMNEALLHPEDYPPSVIDVEGFYMLPN